MMGSWIMFSQVPDFVFVFAELQKATVSPLFHAISFSWRRWWETMSETSKTLRETVSTAHPTKVCSAHTTSPVPAVKVSQSAVVRAGVVPAALLPPSWRMPGATQHRVGASPISANPLGTVGHLPGSGGCQTCHRQQTAGALCSSWSPWHRVSVFRCTANEDVDPSCKKYTEI